jgi:hypothetical protein
VKISQLHFEFNLPKVEQKVRKQVKDFSKKIVISKETVREVRRKNQEVTIEKSIKLEPTSLVNSLIR